MSRVLLGLQALKNLGKSKFISMLTADLEIGVDPGQDAFTLFCRWFQDTEMAAIAARAPVN
jgi:hypothetical protein